MAQAVAPVNVVERLQTSFLEPMRLILLVLTVLIVVVAGISILVSIYNSMSERSHDIAVMRALGASRTAVMAIILVESILLSLLGGFAGLVLGHAVLAGGGAGRRVLHGHFRAGVAVHVAGAAACPSPGRVCDARGFFARGNGVPHRCCPHARRSDGSDAATSRPCVRGHRAPLNMNGPAQALPDPGRNLAMKRPALRAVACLVTRFVARLSPARRSCAGMPVLQCGHADAQPGDRRRRRGAHRGVGRADAGLGAGRLGRRQRRLLSFASSRCSAAANGSKAPRKSASSISARKPPDKKFLITGLAGVTGPGLDWTTPVPLSERAVEYIKRLPTVPRDGGDRLAFFQDYLEDEDPLLAQDAYDEFARMPYDGRCRARPTDEARTALKWINDGHVGPSGRRLYLSMLGVCGKPEDVAMLEQLMNYDYAAMKPGIAAVVDRRAALMGPRWASAVLDEMLHAEERQKRESLDALIACYLKLKGPDGLELINELFLRNPNVEYKHLHVGHHGAAVPRRADRSAAAREAAGVDAAGARPPRLRRPGNPRSHAVGRLGGHAAAGVDVQGVGQGRLDSSGGGFRTCSWPPRRKATLASKPRRLSTNWKRSTPRR